MKLFTHNILRCNKKGVKEGYPLIIEATEVEDVKVDFNPDFVRSVFERVNYAALRCATVALKRGPLPDAVSEEMLEDEKFLRVLHHVLFEIVVTEGQLVCPESGRKFPINKGIPNMLLDEDEV